MSKLQTDYSLCNIFIMYLPSYDVIILLIVYIYRNIWVVWYWIVRAASFLFFGCATQLAVSQFPDQALYLGHGSESPGS